MQKPTDLSAIRLITVSGRIGAGSTSLGKHLAQKLAWKHLEGGEIFWEAIRKRMDVATKDTNLRADEEDQLFDNQLENILTKDNHIVVEAKLAGFFAQKKPGVFKVGVVCEDQEDNDQTEIRIDRLVNREHITVHEAKEEVIEREQNDLTKWRRLYVNNDPDWVYWQKDYFDLVVNTYEHDPEESLALVLKAIGYREA
ncbi:MAG: hypothetical protein AAB553_04470 [Patescibacteria group bacterium]